MTTPLVPSEMNNEQLYDAVTAPIGEFSSSAAACVVDIPTKIVWVTPNQVRSFVAFYDDTTLDVTDVSCMTLKTADTSGSIQVGDLLVYSCPYLTENLHIYSVLVVSDGRTRIKLTKANNHPLLQPLLHAPDMGKVRLRCPDMCDGVWLQPSVAMPEFEQATEPFVLGETKFVWATVSDINHEPMRADINDLIAYVKVLRAQVAVLSEAAGRQLLKPEGGVLFNEAKRSFSDLCEAQRTEIGVKRQRCDVGLDLDEVYQAASIAE